MSKIILELLNVWVLLDNSWRVLASKIKTSFWKETFLSLSYNICNTKERNKISNWNSPSKISFNRSQVYQMK